MRQCGITEICTVLCVVWLFIKISVVYVLFMCGLYEVIADVLVNVILVDRR